MSEPKAERGVTPERLAAMVQAVRQCACRRGAGKASGIDRRRLSEALRKDPAAAALVAAAELIGQLERLEEVGSRITAEEIDGWPNAL